MKLIFLVIRPVAIRTFKMAKKLTSVQKRRKVADSVPVYALLSSSSSKVIQYKKWNVCSELALNMRHISLRFSSLRLYLKII